MAKKFFYRAHTLTLLALVLFGLSACAKKHDLQAALDSISAEELSKNVAVLSSDEFEGRAPASRGEVKTVNFLKDEFQKLGIKPGNGQSYFQDVPMVIIAADPKTRLEIKSGKKSTYFGYGDDFVAVTRRVLREASLTDSEMVFVGYGIIAPEYNWNDYQGLDVRGKTVVMLINDPGYATKDPSLFTGQAMTYYGRWTYKYEEAARQGADGVFIIHETEPAAYPWSVVQNGWTGPQFNLVREDNNMSRCAVEGWLHVNTARKVFQSSGLNYDELKMASAKHGFRAVPLGLRASVTLKNTIRNVKSKNVIALFPGSKRAEEYVIYMAHWDHFGINPELEGDQIFNGALDNATGISGLIELAEAFTKLGSPTRRSIVFLPVTGEEQGLIGSEYYAKNPIFPAAKTVAVINMDALNIYGKMKDITLTGYGLSELDRYVEEEAMSQGRVVRPDPNPERGSFFRSDHFSFARQGFPAIYPNHGIDHVEHGEEWTKAKVNKYISENYHKPSDEYDPNWDLSGAIDDLRLLFGVGYRLAMESAFPNWKEGIEYRAKRDAVLEAAKKK